MSGEFYKMDFRAWNIGTVDLTLEQEAAYLRLCHAMYDVGGPVPNSTRFLQGIFRCGNTRAATLVAQLIQVGKIVVTSNGALFNHRVSEELANRERVSSARRAAGERGGTASGASRSKPLKSNDVAEAIASTRRTRGEERREDKTSLREGERARPRRYEWPDNFREQAWSAYGKAVDKKVSMAALEALWRADRVDFTKLIAGIERQARAVPDAHFRPSLERFIKRERWTDELPAKERENGTGASGRVTRFPSRGGPTQPVFDAVAAGMAAAKARRGIGAREGHDPPGRGGDSDRRAADTPEIDDAQWFDAPLARAAN